MDYDCTDGPLSPGMTLLEAGEIPSADEIRVAPGADFARDCTMLVVWPIALGYEAPTSGTAPDAQAPPRKRTGPTVPVWSVGVAYVEKCLPTPRDRAKPNLDDYNAAVCGFVRRGTAIYLAVNRARRIGSCLFSPGFLGTCLPPPDLFPDAIDGVKMCASLELSPLSFHGPNADVASAEFSVSWQWGGA